MFFLLLFCVSFFIYLFFSVYRVNSHMTFNLILEKVSDYQRICFRKRREMIAHAFCWGRKGGNALNHIKLNTTLSLICNVISMQPPSHVCLTPSGTGGTWKYECLVNRCWANCLILAHVCFRPKKNYWHLPLLHSAYQPLIY